MDYAFVLVGLGNPGAQYEGTRHNCGFMLADLLLRRAADAGSLRDMNGGRFSCELHRVDLPELRGPWLVARPQTFMNLSGQCVQPLLAWHRIPPERLVVAHDELDIPPGALRFKFGGGNAGHNGLKSITQLLGTPDFHRLRVGIGRPEHRGEVTSWVLGRPSAEDAPKLEKALAAGLDVLLALAAHGPDRAAREAMKAGRPEKPKKTEKTEKPEGAGAPEGAGRPAGD